MTRGILIIGNESSLFSAAAAEALKRVESFASVSVPNRFPFPQGRSAPASEVEASTGPIPLSWNPSNPISSRTLLVSAENKLKQINNAIVICSPPALYKTAESLTPEDIEILANDHIKGWFFLIRELILYFRRRGEGSLSFISPEILGGAESLGAAGIDAAAPLQRFRHAFSGGGRSRNTPMDIAGPPASAAFRAFASSALAGAGENFQVMGFTSADADSEAEFAEWFFKIIDEGAVKSSGRWHKYSRLKFFR
ncbi:MAG: hypothetical protein FWD91_07075 [Treponema sp.]|nr:hypothetical protein [Treponema sp.]